MEIGWSEAHDSWMLLGSALQNNIHIPNKHMYRHWVATLIIYFYFIFFCAGTGKLAFDESRQSLNLALNAWVEFYSGGGLFEKSSIRSHDSPTSESRKICEFHKSDEKVFHHRLAKPESVLSPVCVACRQIQHMEMCKCDMCFYTDYHRINKRSRCNMTSF